MVAKRVGYPLQVAGLLVGACVASTWDWLQLCVWLAHTSAAC